MLLQFKEKVSSNKRKNNYLTKNTKNNRPILPNSNNFNKQKTITETKKSDLKHNILATEFYKNPNKIIYQDLPPRQFFFTLELLKNLQQITKKDEFKNILEDITIEKKLTHINKNSELIDNWHADLVINLTLKNGNKLPIIIEFDESNKKKYNQVNKNLSIGVRYPILRIFLPKFATEFENLEKKYIQNLANNFANSLYQLLLEVKNCNDIRELKPKNKEESEQEIIFENEISDYLQMLRKNSNYQSQLHEEKIFIQMNYFQNHTVSGLYIPELKLVILAYDLPTNLEEMKYQLHRVASFSNKIPTLIVNLPPKIDGKIDSRNLKETINYVKCLITKSITVDYHKALKFLLELRKSEGISENSYLRNEVNNTKFNNFENIKEYSDKRKGWHLFPELADLSFFWYDIAN